MTGTHGGKPPQQFTPFYESPRVKINRLWGKTKRLVGTSATVAVIASFIVPGPHTLVLIGGLVAGATVAVVTDKKKKK